MCVPEFQNYLELGGTGSSKEDQFYKNGYF